MSEPIGWNVYYGSRFGEFIPNEEALGPVAAAFVDEVEAFIVTGEG